MRGRKDTTTLLYWSTASETVLNTSIFVIESLINVAVKECKLGVALNVPSFASQGDRQESVTQEIFNNSAVKNISKLHNVQIINP